LDGKLKKLSFTFFSKPHTSLADPWPAPTIIPHITQEGDTCDSEAELAVIIGKAARDVSEDEAMDYVLGYTAANDVSDRKNQLAQSQWSFAKGFDTFCPVGMYISWPNSALWLFLFIYVY